MPSSFLTPLELEYIDGRNWKVTREFDYLDNFEDEHTAIRVPKGFITDFASIPKILWNVLPPTGKYGKAAVVHDFLYRNGGHTDCVICPEDLGMGATYTQEEADQIFYDAMGVLGTPQIQRWVIWKAVRWFGGWSWKG